jgi:hypothetical protein
MLTVTRPRKTGHVDQDAFTASKLTSFVTASALRFSLTEAL